MVTPLGSYNFDEESGDILDHSGNNRDFALNGNGVRTGDGQGHTGKGISQTTFGVTQGPAIFGQTAMRCQMMWIRQNGFTNAAWLGEWKNTSADTGVWGFFFNNDNIQLRAKDSSENVYGPTIPQASDINWHHLCGTYDGTFLKIYWDGVEVNSVEMGVPIWTSASQILLFEETGANLVVDDWRIYDDPLDEFTISTLMNTPVNDETMAGGGAKLYNGTSWVDITPKIYNGTSWVDTTI